jgi:hypothetical protein
MVESLSAERPLACALRLRRVCWLAVLHVVTCAVRVLLLLLLLRPWLRPCMVPAEGHQQQHPYCAFLLRSLAAARRRWG